MVAVVARGRQRLLLDPISLRDTFRWGERMQEGMWLTCTPLCWV